MELMKLTDLKSIINSTFDKALEIQYPLAIKNVERLRRVHPNKSPKELLAYLDKHYLRAVAITGFAAGTAAAVPNGVVQMPVALADLLSSLEASVFYALCAMEIYGVSIEDHERRRLIVTIVLVGDSAATKALRSLNKRTVPYWSKKLINSIPMSTIKRFNKVLGPRFIIKYGTKQGVLVLGKQVPVFLGAGIGAIGNTLFGHFTIASVKKVFGDTPDAWDDDKYLQH